MAAPFNPLTNIYTGAKTGSRVALPAPVETSSYTDKHYMFVDKEGKGGLHRVEYLGNLLQDSYDGIMLNRRVHGMLVHVKYANDGSLLNKYYSLTTYPGTTSIDDWTLQGSGASVTLNNPRTVANLAGRDAIERSTLTGTITVANASTAVSGTGTSFTTQLAVGNKIKFTDDSNVYTIASITDNTNLVLTSNTLQASTAKTYSKILVAANDFVNVADIGGSVPGSFIWDGTQWLRVYAYGNDPNSHAPNTDNKLVSSSGDVTADQLKTLLNTALTSSSINNLATSGNELLGAGEIQNRLNEKLTIPTGGSSTEYLGKDGVWHTIPSGGGGGTTITHISGGNATTTYVL